MPIGFLEDPGPDTALCFALRDLVGDQFFSQKTAIVTLAEGRLVRFTNDRFSA